MKITRLLAPFLVFFAALVSTSAEVETGKPAPDFTLKGADGRNYNLSDFRGKYVVLEWLNHECPFVVKHYESGNMQALQKEAKDKDVVWLSINSSAPGKQGHLDARSANSITYRKKAAPFAVLLDSEGKVGRLFGAKTTPHMFIIDPKGVVIYQGAIDSIKSTDKEDVAKAENYVHKALNEALAGKPVSTSQTPAYGCSVKYAD